MWGNSKGLRCGPLVRVSGALMLLGVGCSGDAVMMRPAGTKGGSLQPGGPGGMPQVGGGSGNPISTANPRAAGGIAGAQAPMICAEGLSNTSPVTPTIWLVIDGSGSMADEFGGSTRWESLRSALMAPDGVVSGLQQNVRFGMVIYSGGEQMVPACAGVVNFACGCYTGAEPACCTAACGGTPPVPVGMCADLVVVDPAISNYMTLDAAYPAHEIGGWTPTDRALEHVVTALPVLNGPIVPDLKKDPIYVILATDGAPNDQCNGAGFGGGGGGAAGFQPVVAKRVVDTVTAGVQKGMHMFVISLAGDDPELSAHLVEVANIGSPGQKPFVPAGKDELVAALQQIIGGATCQVELNGTVAMGQECSGEVRLNGIALPCNAPDGWSMANERTVQLQGTACSSFVGVASQVHAAFPCAVFLPD
jgi:hypothetical protein